MSHFLRDCLLTTFLCCLLAGGLFIRSVSAQSSHDLLGSARASALGHGTTALSSAVGNHANPAAGAAHRQRSVAFYAREGFRLSVLRYGAAYGTWPLRWGTLSGGASTVGTDAYRELHFSADYARSLQLGTTRRAHAGLRVRYYHTSIDGYGSTGAIGLHFGLLVPLLPSLQFGAHATNVNTPSLVEGETLPQTLAVGMQYRAAPDVLVVFDVFKDIDFPASVRGGLEVRPVSLLALRAGITTSPTRFTGGVGIRLGPIRADVAAEQHQVLGWSPSAALHVDW